LQGSIGTSALPALLEAPETSESDLIPGKYEGDGQVLILEIADCCLPDAPGWLVMQTTLQQSCLHASVYFDVSSICRMIELSAMPCLCIHPCGIPAGGFKLWECALDLCEHLCNAFDIRATQQQWSSQLPHGTHVLELGCGHGLPGILMMLAGCNVHFQASGLRCHPVASQAKSEILLDSLVCWIAAY
jgi:hypothetical protein